MPSRGTLFPGPLVLPARLSDQEATEFVRHPSSSTPPVSRRRTRVVAAAMGLTLLLGASSTAAFAQSPAAASAPTARGEAPPLPAAIEVTAPLPGWVRIWRTTLAVATPERSARKD